MGQSSTPTKESGSRTARRDPSFGHLLVVWFLVTPSFFGLWRGASETLSTPLPVTPVAGALLAGTVAVAVLWIAGFRPSVRDSTLYFVTELAVSTLLMLAFFGGRPEAWRVAALRALSIGVAAALSFTGVGRRCRAWCRRGGRRLLQTQTPD